MSKRAFVEAFDPSRCYTFDDGLKTRHSAVVSPPPIDIRSAETRMLDALLNSDDQDLDYGPRSPPRAMSPPPIDIRSDETRMLDALLNQDRDDSRTSIAGRTELNSFNSFHSLSDASYNNDAHSSQPLLFDFSQKPTSPVLPPFDYFRTIRGNHAGVLSDVPGGARAFAAELTALRPRSVPLQTSGSA